MRILQCKDSVFFYNTCNKTKKKSNKYKKAHQKLSQGQVIYIMTFNSKMSQGRVIDIMTFNSYSLQNYSFWKGTRIIGSSDHRIVFVKP